MAEQKYVVVTPIKQAGAKRGAFVKVAPGQPVTLSEEDAGPLLACGAIRMPDVIADDAAQE